MREDIILRRIGKTGFGQDIPQRLMGIKKSLKKRGVFLCEKGRGSSGIGAGATNLWQLP